MKMNIETVNNHYQLGGAETVARQLHEGALTLGHKANFWVGEGSRWPRVKGLRPLYPRLFARLAESRWSGFIGRLAPRRKWTDRSFRALARSDADVIHVHSFHGLYASIESLAAVAKAKPLVWTFHRFWGITGGCDHPFSCERYQTGCGDCPQVGRFAVGPVDHTASEWLLKMQLLADLPFTVVSPSQHLADRIRSSALGKRWKVEVIPNGVGADDFKGDRKRDGDFRKSLGLAENKITVLFTNRDFRDPIKGFPVIKSALESSDCSGVQLLLIGGNSAWARSELSCEIDVVDVGYVSDRKRLAEYYEVSDLFLYASDGENLPCAVLEAMSAECCIVASPVDGVFDLIEPRRDGLLAERNDGTALAKCLREALKIGLDARITLGRNARKRVSEEFSEQKMIDSYLRLYQRVASESRQVRN